MLIFIFVICINNKYIYKYFNEGLSVYLKLTKRETEVVRKICEGFTNIEIGEQLHISKHTVKAQIETIFEKTSCKNRVKLTVWAIRNGVYEI